MLRGIQSAAATAAIVCTLAGCSGTDRPDVTSTSTEGVAAVSPICRGRGGTATITLLSFDESTYRVTGLDARGYYVSAYLTPSTREIAADLSLFPPDPIFPQCGNDAARYDDSLGDGLTSTVLGSIASLATDSCN